MPLPWKKNKVLRISRLMTNFPSPSKRGGSLVVETGFPISLVDSFVKNRDRSKNPSKKKSIYEPQREVSRPVNLTPPPFYSNRELNSSSRCKGNEQRNVFKSTPVEELVVVEQCVADDDGSKKRRVLVAVLRVFLVVVLALGSKKLTIGITKSAFLLLFLEFVGTWSKARMVFDCFVGRVKVLCFYLCKKDDEELKSCEKDSIGGYSDNSVCNSWIVDSKCVVETPVEEIRSERENLEVESGERRDRGLDLEKKERILDENEIKNDDNVNAYLCKKEQSRRAKMRANLRKFFPKKLFKRDKKCKEKEMNSGTEVCYCAVDDKLAEQRNDDKQEQDGEEVLSRS